MDLDGTYLNFYLEPPKGDINFTNLQEICQERLDLHKILRDATNLFKEHTEEWRKCVLKKVEEGALTTYDNILQNKDFSIEHYNNDWISHCMLRFMYCQNWIDRKFFVKLELQLVHWKFKQLNKDQLCTLTKNHSLFKKLAKCGVEKFEMETVLTQCTNLTQEEFADAVFYKTPFVNVQPLVAQRICLLRLGTAYFCDRDLVCYVEEALRKPLKQFMHDAKMMCPLPDERIHDLMKDLLIVREDAISMMPDNRQFRDLDIDNLAENHFPLCMKNIYNHLKENSHMKYHMKLQYVVFLKYIGVPSQEALEYLKMNFMKKCNAKTYKRIEYLFKHIYGLVGINNKYGPPSCEKIINGSVGPMENHGCPFRHFSDNKLEQLLESENMPLYYISQIRQQVKEGKYQLACSTYYKSKSRGNEGNATNSPHDYFKFSSSCDWNCEMDIEDLF